MNLGEHYHGFAAGVERAQIFGFGGKGKKIAGRSLRGDLVMNSKLSIALVLLVTFAFFGCTQSNPPDFGGGGDANAAPPSPVHSASPTFDCVDRPTFNASHDRIDGSIAFVFNGTIYYSLYTSFPYAVTELSRHESGDNWSLIAGFPSNGLGSYAPINDSAFAVLVAWDNQYGRVYKCSSGCEPMGKIAGLDGGQLVAFDNDLYAFGNDGAVYMHNWTRDSRGRDWGPYYDAWVKVAEKTKFGNGTWQYISTPIVRYNQSFYAGTSDGSVWRYENGTGWAYSGEIARGKATSLVVFHERLYAGGGYTGNWDNASSQVYVYEGGTEWRSMGKLADNAYVASLFVFHNDLYGISGRNNFKSSIFRYEGDNAWANEFNYTRLVFPLLLNESLYLVPTNPAGGPCRYVDGTG